MKKIIVLLVALSLYIGFVIYSSQSPAPATTETVMQTGLPSYSDQISTRKENVVRNISINYTAKDTKAIYEKIRDISTQNAGIITGANIATRDNVYSGNISISIPDDKLSSAITALNQLNAKVDSEHSYTQDVTAQRTQLEATLRSEQGLEAKYLLVLKSAKAVHDVTLVTQRLAEVRTRIENVNQQLRMLDTQINSVNFNISLNQPIMIQPIAKPSWSPMSDVKAAGRALEATLEYSLSAIIWLLVYLIPLSIVAAIIYYAYKKVLS